VRRNFWRGTRLVRRVICWTLPFAAGNPSFGMAHLVPPARDRLPLPYGMLFDQFGTMIQSAIFGLGVPYCPSFWRKPNLPTAVGIGLGRRPTVG
jgi:uncharacterized membrane protein YedE/YeeE